MTCTPTRFEALQQAVKVYGSQQAMADDLEVTQPAVSRWVNTTKRLPAEYVLRVEARTGVSRHHLRPDIYPIEHNPGSVHPHAFMGVDRGRGRVSFQGDRVLKGETA
jgi:DNA-binding transcriptional regulator YdaS (Cro superfamily)